MAKTAKKTTTKKTLAKKAPAKRAPRAGRYSDAQRITLLPDGRENPRREGSAPYKRYEVLRKSRTVGAFLKLQPKWHSTIVRAVKDKLIKVS